MDIDFNVILLPHDADLIWYHLKEAILHACQLFIPKVMVSSRPSLKWCNHEIHHQNKRIYSLPRKIEKFNTLYLTSKVSAMELCLQNMIMSSKAAYETGLIYSFFDKFKEIVSTFSYCPINLCPCQS